jgi:hypothetical protein
MMTPYDKGYNDGLAAILFGQNPVSSCPFPEGSSACKAYRRGVRDGMRGFGY